MNEKFVFFHTPRYKLVLSLSYAIFLYLFLIVFLPFGVSNYNPQHEYTFKFLYELSKFIPVVFITSLVNEFLLKVPFKKDQDPGYIIGWTIWSLIVLGIVVFTFYNYLGNWHDWRLSSLPGFVFNTATVLIFPALGVFFFFRYKALQKSYDAVLTNADNRINENEMIQFTGEGAKDNLSVSVSDFIYAMAQDNYSELYYLKNDTVAKFLLRSSLGRLCDQLGHDYLVRCHRSYMINLYNVHSIKGSRKDLQISMSHSETIIPVSKTYAEVTLERLREYKRLQ